MAKDSYVGYQQLLSIIREYRNGAIAKLWITL